MVLDAAALVSLMLIAIPLWGKVVAFCITFYFAVKITMQYALLKSDAAVIRVSTTSKVGQCSIELKNGKTYQASLKDADWLFEYFAVFAFTANTKAIKTIIAKDAMSQEQFYALRLYLRSFNVR